MEYELSKMYAVRAYRSRKGRLAKWTQYKAKGDCAECFASQYEAGLGKDGRIKRLRSAPQMRRSISGGPDLILCNAHTYLWKKRDGDDQA